jgi:hypothetical protein
VQQTEADLGSRTSEQARKHQQQSGCTAAAGEETAGRRRIHGAGRGEGGGARGSNCMSKSPASGSSATEEQTHQYAQADTAYGG